MAESTTPGATVSAVARRYGLTPAQIFRWRRALALSNPAPPALTFAPVVVEAEKAAAAGAGMRPRTIVALVKALRSAR